MAYIRFTDQWFQELKKVNRLVRENIEEKCRPFGITPEQGSVLNYLFLSDHQVNLTELGQYFHVTKGNCSMFCRRLEKAGHIRMIKSDRDGRFINLELTENGRMLMEKMTRLMNEHPQTDAMSQEELELVMKGLKCLEEYLRR